MASKDIRSFRIENDVTEFAKANHISLGSWVNINFRKYEMEVEGLEVKIKELESKLEAFRKKLTEAKELRKKMKLNQIGEKELKFLKDMSKVLDNNPNMLNQLTLWYNEKFIKEISQKDFKKLIEDLK